MPKLKNLKAKVEIHPVYKVPQRIFDIQSQRSKKKPKAIAGAMLKRLSPSLDVSPSQLKFDKVKDTILGHHVFYQQQHAGRPVTGAWLKIDIDKEGRVYHVDNTLIPRAVTRKSKPSGRGLGEAQIRELALRAARGKSAEILETERVTFLHQDQMRPAWKVVVKTARPAHEWRLYLDATSGKVLEKHDQLKLVNGHGLVFDPNPVVALNDTTLENSSVIPDAAYSRVVLRDLKRGGRLDGPFASTADTPNRARSGNGKFLFRRQNDGFREVMAYFHIDRVQRYIQELGFDNVMRRSIKVNVSGPPDVDDSEYSPGTKSLTFGRGGVDDAEDAEIIVHEYGHAVQDDQVPGFGASHQAGSMGEGFGDYLAASFFADLKPERLRPCVGTWDAVAYSRANPPYLRRLDRKKKFPRDMRNEVHADGEIWSACLWELRQALGRRTTDRLVIAHHFQISKKASFQDAANAMLTVDQVLHHGRNQEEIRDVFVRRGILKKPKAGRGSKRRR